MRRRAPVPVAGAVEALAARLEPQTLLGRVQRVWDAAVGEPFAGRTHPVGERGGVVTVRCEASTFANELALLAPLVLDRVNAALGEPLVTELRPTAAGRRHPRS